MKTATLTLPEFWASYLINGDSSSLTAEEVAVVKQVLSEYPDCGAALTCSEEPEFTRFHDAPSSIGACACLEFTFPITGEAAQ